MKEIIPKYDLLNKLLATQEIEKSKCYKKSQFVVFSKNEPLLAYNTFTKQLVEIDENEKKILSSNSLPYTQELDELITSLFLVPIDMDELELYNQIKSFILKITQQQKKSDYLIMTTTDCNARCFYCYEAAIKKQKMTPSVAHKVADYIEQNYDGKVVKTRWFGGEPLYNKEAIDIICSDLRKRDIKYTSTMISNGYLFDDEVIRTAVNIWHLTWVQITLDGTENVYNRCKNYIYQSSESPFKRVCNNIEKLLDNNITVVVRMNMDKHNNEDLFTLSEYLCTRFKGRKNFSIYVALLFDNDSQRPFNEKIELVNQLNKLEDFFVENGFSNSNLKRKLSVTHCMADRDNSTVINPSGDLGKCEHYAYSELWGSIFEPEKCDNDVILSWKQPIDKIPECNSCPMVPLCIAPKRCPENGRRCDEATRMLKMNKLQNAMRKEYNKYLERHQFEHLY